MDKDKQNFLPMRNEAREVLDTNTQYSFLPSHLRGVASQAVKKSWGKYADLAPQLVKHVYAKETGNIPENKKDVAVSPAGAVGRFQLMPKGAGHGLTMEQLTNPAINTQRGVEYLGDMVKLYRGDTEKALAAYNYGQGNLNKKIAQYGDNWRSGLPSETRKYIDSFNTEQSAGKYSSDPNSLGNLLNKIASLDGNSASNLAKLTMLDEFNKESAGELAPPEPIYRKPTTNPIKNIVNNLFNNEDQDGE